MKERVAILFANRLWQNLMTRPIALVTIFIAHQSDQYEHFVPEHCCYQFVYRHRDHEQCQIYQRPVTGSLEQCEMAAATAC